MQVRNAATDGRLKRGDDTRHAVLARAVDVASEHGLDGLSIGQLATDLGISKSGLFAHFGAKDQLQLATIAAARRVYVDTVVRPALRTPPGLARLWALSSAWLDYSDRRVFPGGCFFSKTLHEFGTRPGVVRDALVAANDEWLELLRQVIEEARSAGELTAATDAERVAFQLQALYEGANLASILGDANAYDRARSAIQDLLGSIASEGVALPWVGERRARKPVGKPGARRSAGR